MQYESMGIKSLRVRIASLQLSCCPCKPDANKPEMTYGRGNDLHLVNTSAGMGGGEISSVFVINRSGIAPLAADHLKGAGPMQVQSCLPTLKTGEALTWQAGPLAFFRRRTMKGNGCADSAGA